MPYVGMFSGSALDDSIQNAINRAGSVLGDGQSGIVVHLDTKGELSASVIKKFGDIVSVEGAAVLDTSHGYHFDKEHLSIEGNLIVRF